jgi:uncharacterized surface protein with fasciclin (FAS1) repeats
VSRVELLIDLPHTLTPLEAKMLFKSLALSALAGAAVAQDLITLLANQTELSNLTTYLGLFPDLVSQLASASNITLLAPNNAAFARFLNSSAGQALADNNTDLLTATFTYHVLTGTYDSFGNETMFIPTLLQPGMFANVTGGQVVEAVGDGNQTSIFSGLLNNATTSGSPLNFTGGVVHVIDEVLTIPQNISTTAIAANLTAVAGALISANLVDTVDTLSDVTVFAPSNEAFERIGSALPNLTTEQLTSILQYHVVQGVVGYSTGLMNMSLPTVGGTNVTITVEDGAVFVNSARVIVPNVLVANGVVHVIDNVLNPMNATATANPTESTGAPAFSGASSASSLPFTSGVPTPTATAATESAPGATGATSTGAAVPMKTGAVAAAALFGGAAIVMNM